jgi:hypothetical protein
MIYIKNLATGMHLSSQPDGRIERNRQSVGGWELFELRNESGGVLTLTCPAHDHGRLYRLTMVEMTDESPLEGAAQAYVPFVWAG